MDLRSELEESISNSFKELKRLMNDHNRKVAVSGTVDIIWEILEDKIGPVQEKLLNDLTFARSERDAALNKVEVLANEVRRLRSDSVDVGS